MDSDKDSDGFEILSLPETEDPSNVEQAQLSETEIDECCELTENTDLEHPEPYATFPIPHDNQNKRRGIELLRHQIKAELEDGFSDESDGISIIEEDRLINTCNQSGMDLQKVPVEIQQDSSITSMQTLESQFQLTDCGSSTPNIKELKIQNNWLSTDLISSNDCTTKPQKFEERCCEKNYELDQATIIQFAEGSKLTPETVVSESLTDLPNNNIEEPSLHNLLDFYVESKNEEDLLGEDRLSQEHKSDVGTPIFNQQLPSSIDAENLNHSFQFPIEHSNLSSESDNFRDTEKYESQKKIAEDELTSNSAVLVPSLHTSHNIKTLISGDNLKILSHVQVEPLIINPDELRTNIESRSDLTFETDWSGSAFENVSEGSQSSLEVFDGESSLPEPIESSNVQLDCTTGPSEEIHPGLRKILSTEAKIDNLKPEDSKNVKKKYFVFVVDGMSDIKGSELIFNLLLLIFLLVMIYTMVVVSALWGALFLQRHFFKRESQMNVSDIVYDWERINATSQILLSRMEQSIEALKVLDADIIKECHRKLAADGSYDMYGKIIDLKLTQLLPLLQEFGRNNYLKNIEIPIEELESISRFIKNTELEANARKDILKIDNEVFLKMLEVLKGKNSHEQDYLYTYLKNIVDRFNQILKNSNNKFEPTREKLNIVQWFASTDQDESIFVKKSEIKEESKNKGPKLNPEEQFCILNSENECRSEIDPDRKPKSNIKNSGYEKFNSKKHKKWKNKGNEETLNKWQTWQIVRGKGRDFIRRFGGKNRYFKSTGMLF